jgi:hypothetical protein
VSLLVVLRREPEPKHALGLRPHGLSQRKSRSEEKRG